MKKIHKLLFLMAFLVLAVSLTACGGKGDGNDDSQSGNAPSITVTNDGNSSAETVRASGTMSEQMYELSGGPYRVVANGISMSNGNCKIVISPAEEGSCVVTVDDNVDISVDVDEGAKSIEITGGHEKMFEGIHLKIEINAAVETVDVDGAFHVTYDAGTLERAEITASGACQITATGECQMGLYMLSGASQLNAYDLKCEKLTVSATGACTAEVFASQSLEAEASGTSSIRYDGNPQDTQAGATGLASVEPR